MTIELVANIKRILDYNDNANDNEKAKQLHRFIGDSYIAIPMKAEGAKRIKGLVESTSHSILLTSH